MKMTSISISNKKKSNKKLADLEKKQNTKKDRREMQIYHPPSFPTIDCNLQVIIIIINNHSYESQIFRKENQITLRISKINLTRKEKGICVTLKA